MRKKTRRRLNSEEIFLIWKGIRVDGKKASQVSRDLNLPYHLVSGTDARLEKYISGNTIVKRKEYDVAALKAKTHLLEPAKKVGIFSRLVKIFSFSR